mmetsp:Transcript_51678/g.129681  ORF Transcript_51678/g.129681 Transcript_51678/m.129681 type:complete len:207 (+) Transcript_51678:1047-1667(+)
MCWWSLGSSRQSRFPLGSRSKLQRRYSLPVTRKTWCETANQWGMCEEGGCFCAAAAQETRTRGYWICVFCLLNFSLTREDHLSICTGAKSTSAPSSLTGPTSGLERHQGSECSTHRREAPVLGRVAQIVMAKPTLDVHAHNVSQTKEKQPEWRSRKIEVGDRVKQQELNQGNRKEKPIAELNNEETEHADPHQHTWKFLDTSLDTL